MTNAQLYLAMGAPVLANAVLIGLLMAYIKLTPDSMRIDRRFDRHVCSLIGGITPRRGSTSPPG
jgi:hypothetical protein